MIYTVIFDPLERENSIRIKKDCRVLRQSLLDFPEDISEYINKAKSPVVKAERQAAYTSLLCSLKLFFDIENPLIKRESKEKPTIISHKIFFNISHTASLVGVTISDECEVGLDIQAATELKREKKLEERFLCEYKFKSQKIDAKFYLCKLKGDCLEFYEIDLDEKTEDSFIYKWVAFESILKLLGKGFGGASEMSTLAEKAMVDIRRFRIENCEFSLANSIKTVKM